MEVAPLDPEEVLLSLAPLLLLPEPMLPPELDPLESVPEVPPVVAPLAPVPDVLLSLPPELAPLALLPVVPLMPELALPVELVSLAAPLAAALVSALRLALFFFLAWALDFFGVVASSVVAVLEVLLSALAPAELSPACRRASSS